MNFFCYEELKIMGYKVKKPKIINNNFVIKELKKKLKIQQIFQKNIKVGLTMKLF